MAQIDTGCQFGDVINGRVLRGLRGETHLRNSDSPMWMCSGLNNQCVESTNVLVSFNKSDLKHTFSLPVQIAPESKVDLILGLQTIKNLNLVKIIPDFFQNLDKITPSAIPTSPLKKQRVSFSAEEDALVPFTVLIDTELPPEVLSAESVSADTIQTEIPLSLLTEREIVQQENKIADPVALDGERKRGMARGGS